MIMWCPWGVRKEVVWLTGPKLESILCISSHLAKEIDAQNLFFSLVPSYGGK
jgi:hypothetical protein